MQIQLKNIEFAIAVNTFSDDVKHKLEILAKMELEFLRKFEHRVQISQFHSEMVYEIRRIVSTIEEMYRDVKDYFVKMKVDFMFDFVRKIQTLMVIGYNHLSQALLITYDMYQSQRKKNLAQPKPTNICACQAKHDYVLTKDQLKRLQHIDYAINSLEAEEERLVDEMAVIYDRIMLQKTFIDQVQPSLATKQLEEMKDHIEAVMENNQKLFEENYMMKFFEFHKHIKKLDKPQKINEVYNKLNASLKSNFVSQAMKAAKRIQNGRRFNPDMMHSIEVQTEQPSKQKNKDPVWSEANTAFSKTPNAVYGMMTKQKKINQKMHVQLNMLNKQNLGLVEELSSEKQGEKQIEVKYRELVERFLVVEGMYHKAKVELDDVKAHEQFQTQQFLVETKRIKTELAILRGQNTPLSNANAYVQTDSILHFPDSRIKSKNFIGWNECAGDEKETQTQEENLLRGNDDEIIKLLKTRNEKAINMLNEKDKQIRHSASKLNIFEAQNTKIKSTLNIFVGIVQEKFIGAKYMPHDLPQTPLQSILEMNSQQIEKKVKQVIRMIAPGYEFCMSQNSDLPPLMKGQCNKVTSIKSKPIQTLQDEQFDNGHSNEQLTFVERSSNYSKTICNFASDSLEDKKKKRLNVFAILGGKRNYNLTKNNAECQTQLTETHFAQFFRSLGEKSTINFKNLDCPTKLGKNQICPQQMIGEQISKVHQINKKTSHSNRLNTLEARKHKAVNEERSPVNRAKKAADSGRKSQQLITMKKNATNQKINLNTFEKLKIKQLENETERQSASRSFGRNGICEYLQNQKRTIQNLSTGKNSPIEFSILQTNDGHKTSKTSLIEGIHQTHEGMSKYEETERPANIKTSPHSSRLNHLSTSKNFSIREKFALQKNKHNRIASEMPELFRPIFEISQGDKQNKANILLVNTQQRSFGRNLQNFQDTQFSTTNPNFSKFKAEQARSAQKIQRQKNLLFSVQTCKPTQNKANELMIERCMKKMVQKWGKDKIQSVISSIAARESS